MEVHFNENELRRDIGLNLKALAEIQEVFG
jgi:hypothetical protein